MASALPFGQAVRCWRQQAGLTQQALAKLTRIPQPNLSAIEQSGRAVSLGTIRTLAAALNVRPGMLVDGVPPGVADTRPAALSRQTIERVANAVAFDRPLAVPAERAVADALRALVAHRTRALRRQPGRPQTVQQQTRVAWTQLKSVYGRSAIEMLADRVLERQRAHEPSRH